MGEPFVLISGPPFGPQYAAAEELALRLPGAAVVTLDSPEPGDPPVPVVPSELTQLLRTADGPVLAPVTPRDPRLLTAVLVPVLALGHDVRHVVLVRTLDDVWRRLHRGKEAARPARPMQGGLSWADLAPCVETTGLTVAELADKVATTVGLRLPG